MLACYHALNILRYKTELIVKKGTKNEANTPQLLYITKDQKLALMKIQLSEAQKGVKTNMSILMREALDELIKKYSSTERP